MYLSLSLSLYIYLSVSIFIFPSARAPRAPERGRPTLRRTERYLYRSVSLSITPSTYLYRSVYSDLLELGFTHIHRYRYVCMSVNIRRHQHTRVHARTGPQLHARRVRRIFTYIHASRVNPQTLYTSHGVCPQPAVRRHRPSTHATDHRYCTGSSIYILCGRPGAARGGGVAKKMLCGLEQSQTPGG